MIRLERDYDPELDLEFWEACKPSYPRHPLREPSPLERMRRRMYFAQSVAKKLFNKEDNKKVSDNDKKKTGQEDEKNYNRFQKPPARVPTRSIMLASFLCLFGSSLLIFGCMILTGHLDAKYADRVWPMVIMGFLMFIPGAYHVRIAYYAHKGIPGYSFDDIPEFE